MTKYMITADVPAVVALVDRDGAVKDSANIDATSGVIMHVRDSRGTFSFEEWQKMPPEVPPPLKPLWRE